MMRGSQLERLSAGVDALLKGNRFYQARLHPVRTWDDFERLPLTTKDEITADQEASPPFGTNLTFPIERYSRMHQTSGTSGTTPTEQRLRTMLELRATVLCSTPTYAIRLAEAARAAGINLATSDIRITVHAGEPGASVPATRDLIERSFGARCFDHTGMTELGPTGVSCAARDGVHLIESEFVFEVRDDAGTVHSLPETGTITGELVATNLGRWGSALIRYRTGDRVEVTRASCECGSPFAKMLGGIRGRVDDMFTVRGVNLYPSQVENLVRRHAVIAEFSIEVRSV